MALSPTSSRGSSGSDLLLSQAFALTSAQLKAATLTPVSVVAAPGANKVILLVGGVYEYIFVTTPYSNGGFDFALGSNAVGSVGSIGDVLNQSAARVTAWIPVSSDTVHPRAAMVNQPLVLATTLTGSIASTALGTGGISYAAGDTGTLTGGTGGTYIVNTVDGDGAVLTYTVTNAGTGYSAGGTAGLVPGGAQPGVGQSGAVSILTVDASGETGDGTLSGVVFYTVATVA